MPQPWHCGSRRTGSHGRTLPAFHTVFAGTVGTAPYPPEGWSCRRATSACRSLGTSSPGAPSPACGLRSGASSTAAQTGASRTSIRTNRSFSTAPDGAGALASGTASSQSTWSCDSLARSAAGTPCHTARSKRREPSKELAQVNEPAGLVHVAGHGHVPANRVGLDAIAHAARLLSGVAPHMQAAAGRRYLHIGTG